MQETTSVRGRVTLVVGPIFVGLVLFGSQSLTAQTVTRIVTASGSSLSTIFSGLKPSQFALDYRIRRTRPHSTGAVAPTALKDRLDGVLVRVQCQQCPATTVCADHYQLIVESTGCTDPFGACPPPLHNATTDTHNAGFSDGAEDTYCGVYCCLDTEQCDNP